MNKIIEQAIFIVCFFLTVKIDCKSKKEILFGLDLNMTVQNNSFSKITYFGIKQMINRHQYGEINCLVSLQAQNQNTLDVYLIDDINSQICYLQEVNAQNQYQKNCKFSPKQINLKTNSIDLNLFKEEFQTFKTETELILIDNTDFSLSGEKNLNIINYLSKQYFLQKSYCSIIQKVGISFLGIALLLTMGNFFLVFKFNKKKANYLELKLEIQGQEKEYQQNQLVLKKKSIKMDESELNKN